jgi:hypothetical protein
MRGPISRHSERSNGFSNVADLNLEGFRISSTTDNLAPRDEIKASGYFPRARLRNPR